MFYKNLQCFRKKATNFLSSPSPTIKIRPTVLPFNCSNLRQFYGIEVGQEQIWTIIIVTLKFSLTIIEFHLMKIVTVKFILLKALKIEFADDFYSLSFLSGIVKLVRHQEEGWIRTCRQVQPLKKHRHLARWRFVLKCSFDRVSPELFDKNKKQTKTNSQIKFSFISSNIFSYSKQNSSLSAAVLWFTLCLLSYFFLSQTKVQFQWKLSFASPEGENLQDFDCVRKKLIEFEVSISSVLFP